MEKQKVLVAGASGYLGRHAVREFAARGYSVRAMVRDREKLSTEGPNLEPPISEFVTEYFTADALDTRTMKGACKGMDLVFSCMGLTKPQDHISSEQVDHLGNRALLEDAIACGIRKFIYISVFNAEKMMGSDIVKAHELFVMDLKASGLPYTVIRPTAYFSDMGMFFNMARSGHIYLFGDGSNRFNPIHGADLAKVCADAAERNETEIDVGGPETFTYNETNIMAFNTLGIKPSITHVPMWIADAGLFLTGLFNKPLASVMSFAISVSRFDNVAPPTGSKGLADFYSALAAKE